MDKIDCRWALEMCGTAVRLSVPFVLCEIFAGLAPGMFQTHFART